jgi:hypothetical protein
VRTTLTAAFLFGVTSMVSACGNKAQQQPEYGGSLYGTPHHLLGKAMLGQETVFILLCDSRDTFDTGSMAEQLERSCALELSEAASSALIKFHGGNAESVGGEYWISGTGRRTKAAGSFGHGGYSCEVRFDDVSSVDDGPPRFWTAPPPNAGPEW